MLLQCLVCVDWEQVWDYAHGRDDRVVAPSQVRKSVGAEINYAVRLDSVGDADKFVDELAGMEHF